MYLRDAPIKYQRMGHRKTGSVHLVDQGERGRGQTNNRPPAGSEYWSVHWLSTDELKTDVRGGNWWSQPRSRPGHARDDVYDDGDDDDGETPVW